MVRIYSDSTCDLSKELCERYNITMLPLYIILGDKDYRDGGSVKEMTLDGVEFVRRYAQHVLPYRFVHIRHYGILAPGNRKVLAVLQAELGHPPVAANNRGRKRWADIAAVRSLVIGLCPHCGVGILIMVRTLPHIRSPERNPSLYVD